MLRFPIAWRIQPPPDGKHVNSRVPAAAREEFLQFAMASAPGVDREEVLWAFKEPFSHAAGFAHPRPSSSLDYAKYDLNDRMNNIEGKPPQFIEAFEAGCRTLRDRYGEDAAANSTVINSILAKHDMGYRIEGDTLLLRDSVEVIAVPTTSLLSEARNEFSEAVEKSEQYLADGKGIEAVQQILWLLESISTAFTGKSTGAHTVRGKYFVDIMKDLQKEPNTTRQFAVRILEQIHGFMSSPSGGKVRHGASMTLPPLAPHEAVLFVNLIRAYVAYLLEEYERLTP